MKTEELRVNSIIDYNGMEVAVFSVDKKEFVTFETKPIIVGKWEYEQSPSLHISYFKPIPLTEEWHNKFGISKNGFGNYVYDIPNNKSLFIQIVFNNDYVSITQGIQKIDDIINIWNKDVIKRDMYVHEWQNLYHLLTGEELTIKTK